MTLEDMYREKWLITKKTCPESEVTTPPVDTPQIFRMYDPKTEEMCFWTVTQDGRLVKVEEFD
jgi:hypothetical protein